MKNKSENKNITNIISQIKSHNLIILEGAISVLSALYSDNSKISKIILKSGIQNRNTHQIVSAVKTKNINNLNIEYFSSNEFTEFEKIINNSGLYSIGKTHGGIIALTFKREFLTPENLINLISVRSPNITDVIAIAIIEGIEDPYNLGYAVRVLYTQGINGLILPERDFGFSESVIEKASTGTFSKMPIAVFPGSSQLNVPNPKTELLKLLKNNGFKIYCIDKKSPENSKTGVRDIFDVQFAYKTVFIIGGEKRGISKDFLYNADEIVRIPYAKSFSHSLASQTAATIVSYEIHRQRRRKK